VSFFRHQSGVALTLNQPMFCGAFSSQFSAQSSEALANHGLQPLARRGTMTRAAAEAEALAGPRGLQVT
jgi:hypothetical protein